jgi:hypothetical protein
MRNRREDPRRALIEVIQRLGRATQLHLDERHRHFRITDIVIIATSLLLLLGAGFDVYHARVLNQDFNEIIADMYSMQEHLVGVDADMGDITGNMKSFDDHMIHMDSISARMTSMSRIMPQIRGNTQAMAGEMASVEENMGRVRNAMGILDSRIHAMTGGVVTMREHMGQFARPMSGIAPFMP